MEPKKISFGFSKINKKLNLLKNNSTQIDDSNKIELIKCLEGQQIQLVEEKPEVAPLVIPLKESQKTSAALASLMKRRAVLLGEDDTIVSETASEIGTTGNENLTASITDDIEKRAARELLADLKVSNTEKSTENLVLPVVHPDDLPLEGAKESSLDDYDNIPIEQFGKAMLRGMGWAETSKSEKAPGPIDDSPMVRPKGMGLGADKALKAKPLLVAPESNEVLEIKKKAFVRILGGKHKDLYGQIEGFDDHAGRVIVKMAIGGFKEAFNEFLCQPISRKEFSQYGKCINSTKYDEYKKKENEYGQIILKKEIAEVDKKCMKREKLTKEVQMLSSDDECKIVEKKSLKKESTSSSYRDSKHYDDRDVMPEKNAYKQERPSSIKQENKKESGSSYRNSKHYDDRDVKLENNAYKQEYASIKQDDKKESSSSYRDSKHYDDRNVKLEKNEYKQECPPSIKQEDDFRKRENDRERNRYRERDTYDKYGKIRYKDDKSKVQSTSDCTEKNRDEDIKSSKYRERSRDRHESTKYNSYQNNTNDKIRQHNTNSSDESDCDDGKKHKKSSKLKKSRKKSKKSKKSKSKNNESDSETSADANTSTSDYERHKRHKNKSKKSKKERERSRSRGRRQ